MELQHIVNRYAESIQSLDPRVSARGMGTRSYQPGFASLPEATAIQMIDAEWEQLHPGERSDHRVAVRYPGTRASADHVVSCHGRGNLQRPEWALEIKRLQFFGDNGKRNDYAVGKVLSPYLKDRGMLHDALRLRESEFTERIAIIGYGFDQDALTVAEARRRHTHRDALTTIINIEREIQRDGPMHLETLVEFAEAILGLRGLKKGPRAQAEFDAWHHPAGGRGLLFGWEIRRPRLDPTYDPRHPW